MDKMDLLGLLAGMFTTAAFLPQVIKTWRSKSAKDLSLGMFSMLVAGLILWLIYGILNQDIPIIFTNGVTLALASVILYFKIMFH